MVAERKWSRRNGVEEKKERRKEKVAPKYLYVFALYSAAFPGKPGIDRGGVGNSSIIKSRFV